MLCNERVSEPVLANKPSLRNRAVNVSLLANQSHLMQSLYSFSDPFQLAFSKHSTGYAKSFLIAKIYLIRIYRNLSTVLHVHFSQGNIR